MKWEWQQPWLRGAMATVRGPGVMRTEVSSTPRPLAGEGLLPLHHYLFPSLPQGRREGGWESTGTPGGGEPESGSERTGRGLSQNAPWDRQADGWQMVLSALEDQRDVLLVTLLGWAVLRKGTSFERVVNGQAGPQSGSTF